MSSHCPIAATACFSLVSLGFSGSPSLPAPSPTAPEDTMIISLPELWRSEMTLTRLVILLIFSLPVLCARVEVPSFITMRFFCEMFLIIYLLSVNFIYRRTILPCPDIAANYVHKTLSRLKGSPGSMGSYSTVFRSFKGSVR